MGYIFNGNIEYLVLELKNNGTTSGFGTLFLCVNYNHVILSGLRYYKNRTLIFTQTQIKTVLARLLVLCQSEF